MNNYRFREYDALGLRRRVPGEKVASVHHISKRKQKQKDVEVVFDVKDYKEYVTGFRKRKQQRRQDAQKQIKEKQRQERNQQRSEKRTKLKEKLGLGDDYGVCSTSEDDDNKDVRKQPHTVTVYKGDDGMTTTVTTMPFRSSDDEQPGDACCESDVEDEGADDRDRNEEGLDAAGWPDSSSGRRAPLPTISNGGGGAKRSLQSPKFKLKRVDKPGGDRQLRLTSRGGGLKGSKKGAAKKRLK
ncbi:hypothetical protein Vretimale_4644 [Volvox reticuliferus]|uniref:Nucleolar protein 12 n=1 Tax=Volvox reticuliferus TaxID=1737510 RepID=A0A8J4FJ78_9CHLO|nr:hypothetical protein Vretifemale_3253 [Volvox reticuliferus]GIL99493.1 hypothetical protein Vretimale_4644 [Volvox reticuliferus]